MSAAVLLYSQFSELHRLSTTANEVLRPNILPRSIHINESTGTSAPAWVSDPSGRGTHDLIASCLTTLLSCGFTAVHVNILPNASRIQAFFVRVVWMAIAIFAPEVVLWCAFEQLRAARQLRDAINKLGQQVCDGDLARQVNTRHIPKHARTRALLTAEMGLHRRMLLKPGADVRIYLLTPKSLKSNPGDHPPLASLLVAKSPNSRNGPYPRPFTQSAEASPSTPPLFGLKTALLSPLPESSNSQN